MRQRDAILHAPAAARNVEPILEVLRQVLPERGLVLEIASGTGQHVERFAGALPGLHWQPSDPDPAHRASIAARIAEMRLCNVRQPMDLDVLGAWPELQADAVIVANLLHVAPPEATEGLLKGAALTLREGGLLHVYGPFNRHGRYTSEGNARFDQALREQHPAWGLRDVETVLAAGEVLGLSAMRVVDMPANNLSVVMLKAQPR